MFSWNFVHPQLKASPTEAVPPLVAVLATGHPRPARCAEALGLRWGARGGLRRVTASRRMPATNLDLEIRRS